MTPTQDFRLVRRITGRDPVVSNRVVYLLDDEGVWTLHEHEDGVMIHADMPPHQRGKRAVTGAREAFRWVFDNLPAKTIYAGIPKERKPACFLAALAGMTFTHESDGMRWYRYG